VGPGGVEHGLLLLPRQARRQHDGSAGAALGACRDTGKNDTQAEK